MKFKKNSSRRGFIKNSIITAAGLAIIPAAVFGEDSFPVPIKNLGKRVIAAQNGIKTVAFIANVYRNRSHADVIGTKLFMGIPTDEGMVTPQVKIVSMWIDQIGATDTGVRLSEMHGATVYPTIAEALTLGGDKLAVDAVIYIGEHGTYKKNRLGATMYPRMNYLEQIFRVFDASNKVVPLFSDKHLSYSWLDSKWIYDRSKELNVPMMAGSTLPYAWRDPVFQHPIGTKIKEAVAIGYASLDSYGIHAIEILQCMIERRKGGETGVRSVQTLSGNDVWTAIDTGKISKKLIDAGIDLIKKKPAGSMRDFVKMPYAVLIQYSDGTKGSILMLQGYMDEHWAYAANAEGKTVATEFVLDRSKNISRYYPLNIQKFIVTGKPTAPIERNLLTSGIMDTVLRSLNDGELKKTPFLNIKYTADGFEPILPKNPRPIGASRGPWPPKGYEFLER